MTFAPALSVALCTHNPDRVRLSRVLQSLASQTLPADRWELVLVDNQSAPPLSGRLSVPARLTHLRIVEERELGLTPARRAGIEAALGEVLVFVDDDNVLSPDYLQAALDLMTREPQVGAAGGIIEAEWETPPPLYAAPYLSLLGVRDFGARPMRALVHDRVGPWEPIGAGMVIRKTIARHYRHLAGNGPRGRLDRRGSNLGSCGDTDMARCAVDLGYYMAYEPALRMTHIIPAFRLTYRYLLRLCYSLKRSGILLDRIRTGEPQPLRSRATKWLRLPLDVLRAVTVDPRSWGLAVATRMGEYDARLTRLDG